MKNIYFNPFFEYNKSPIGAVLVGKEICIRISISQGFNIWDLQLIVQPDGTNEEYIYNLNYESTENYNIYSTRFSIMKSGLYWYHFRFSDCYGTHYIYMDANMDAVLTDEVKESFQLSIHDEFVSNLDWYKGGVMYQILPDRFNKVGNSYCHPNGYMHKNWDEHPNYLPVNGKILNNDYFGGNLKGIIEKLPYLNELGIKSIYLNPISLAFSNHRYDTADYMTLDPMLGDERDFKKLCIEAKKFGMGIIIDGVFNHTGSNSIYFNKEGHFDSLGAYQSKSSPYYHWYRFIKFPNKYHSWWGFDTLPSVNQKSGFVDFIVDKVIKKWMRLGAKGYRLDVVDELNDRFIEKISKSMKEENSNSVLIGEVWEDASNKMAYGHRKKYFNGHQLDSVMNYPLRKAINDFVLKRNTNSLRNIMRTTINNYPKNVLDNLMIVLGTHDTPRILSICGNVQFGHMTKTEQANYHMDSIHYEIAAKKLKLAAVLQYTLPGVPCLYYGDEAGLEGYKDPFCRKTMPWDNVDKELHDFYKKLGQIRKENAEFKEGKYYELFTKKGIFGFRRENIYIIVNNTDESLYYDLNAVDLLTNEKNSRFEVKQMTARIMKRC